MEHTPKNLLIRAVKQGKRKENREAIEAILKEDSYGTYVVSVVDGREVNGAAAMDFMSEV